MTDRAGAAGRTVLIAGATSAAGLATARALAGAGARVVAVGRDPEKLTMLSALDGVQVERCDVTDPAAVADLVRRVHGTEGPVDGLVCLVGGWRGGGGLAGQSEEDYRVLESAFTALRVTSRALDEDLRASAAGRLAIVSSTAVARPLAGGANYAAVKAASEAWTRAVAQGFAKAARDAGDPLRAAAVVFRAKALDADALAAAVVALWDDDAAALNDRIIDLTA
ncbi:MAG: SDR family NAD(P)-dependent oxidoreductase [Actinomycetota bacterium]